MHDFLARLLRTGAGAYAGYACSELLEGETEGHGGTVSFRLWQKCLAERVSELAAAVAARRPTLFVSQVHWARAMLAGRGVAPERFQAALIRLKNVLQRELPETVQALSSSYLDQAINSLAARPEEAENRLVANTPHGHLASTYLLALLKGDRKRARQVIQGALDANESVPDMYRHVLLPAQRELGRMWLAGEINVAEEHFASHTTKMVMGQLLGRADFQAPNGKTLMAAAVHGNEHDIGLYAVADFFEMAGWRIVQLGAQVPVDDMVQAVECFDVDLLALSAALHVHIHAVKATIEAVRDGGQGKDVKILLGGGAFTMAPRLPVEIGADAYARDVDEAVRIGNQLVGLPPAEIGSDGGG